MNTDKYEKYLSQDTREQANKPTADSFHRDAALERFRQLRKKTVPLAEAQGFFSDDDVFKVVS
jgi:hypothetical protein